ncbi:MAG: hypothetical protein NUW37_19175 [Planctomycetes bacterium]|nr:hypothetical protein [Planctomycetota bacterium]
MTRTLIFLLTFIISLTVSLSVVRGDEGRGSWRRLSSEGAPDGRGAFSAFWTGDKLIVWGGTSDGRTFPQNGGIYDPKEDKWTIMSDENAPEGRFFHSAAWTGSKLVIWGGGGRGGPADVKSDGAAYDLETDTWTKISEQDAPSARFMANSVWTGTEMIVWGGIGEKEKPLSDGRAYDPETDSWSYISSLGNPGGRAGYVAIFENDRMLVFGGFEDLEEQALSTGGFYDPAEDAWEGMSDENSPGGAMYQTVVSTGSEIIVFGGVRGQRERDATDSGGIYNLESGEWREISHKNSPGRRALHSAVWTGNSMIVYGGIENQGGDGLKTGGIYYPATTTAGDEWEAIKVDPDMIGRVAHSAVWTGEKMLVFGGGETPRAMTNELWEYDPEGK